MNLSFVLSESKAEGPLLHRGSCHVLQQAILVHACHVILALRYLSENSVSLSPFVQEDLLNASPTDSYCTSKSQLLCKKHTHSSIMDAVDTRNVDVKKASSSFDVSLGLVSMKLDASHSRVVATPLTHDINSDFLPFTSPASARDYLRSAPKYGILTAAHFLRCTSQPYRHCHYRKGALAAHVERLVRQNVAWCTSALAQLSQWILRSWVNGEMEDDQNDILCRAPLSIEDLLRCAVDVSPGVHTVSSTTMGAEKSSHNGKRAVFISELFLQVFPEMGFETLGGEKSGSQEEVQTINPTDVNFDFACGCPHLWMRETLPRWLLGISLVEHATTWCKFTHLKHCFYRWRLRRGFGVLRKIVAGDYNRPLMSGEEPGATLNAPNERFISMPPQYPLVNQPNQLSLIFTGLKEKDGEAAKNLDQVGPTDTPDDDKKESTIATTDAPSSIENRSIPSLPSAFASQPLTRQPSISPSPETAYADKAPFYSDSSLCVRDDPEARKMRYTTEIDKHVVPPLKVENSNDESHYLDSGFQKSSGQAKPDGKNGYTLKNNDCESGAMVIRNVKDNSQYEVRISAPTRLFAEDSIPSTAKPSPAKLSDEISAPCPRNSCQASDNLVESNCATASLIDTNTDHPLNYIDKEAKDSKGMEASSNFPLIPSSHTGSLLTCLVKTFSLRRVRNLFLFWRDHRYYTAVALRYVQTLRREHILQHCFRHWFKRENAHLHSRKELEDEQRCGQVVKTKMQEVVRDLLRLWRDAALVARFSMQSVGRRVFRRWRLTVVRLAYSQKYNYSHGGSSSKIGNQEEKKFIRNILDRWREKFMLVRSSRWHQKREQLKVYLSLLLRARQERYHRSLLLRNDKLLKASVFRWWLDRFEKQTRLNAFSKHYALRRMELVFTHWKDRYALRGASTDQEAAFKRQHEGRRLERDFLFWKKRLWLRRRLLEVNERYCFGRVALIKHAWDRWTTRTRYRLTWWQGQGEIAEGFRLNALARHSLLCWVRRCTRHRQLFKENMHSRMESRAVSHYVFHLSAKTFFIWKTKMFLITKFNVDMRRRLPKAALQLPIVQKESLADGRGNASAQLGKYPIPKKINKLTPSTRSIESSPPNSESLKKVPERREKEAPALRPQALSTKNPRHGCLLRKKVPKKAQNSAGEASSSAKKGNNSSTLSSALTLHPSPSSATIMIAGEAIDPTRAQHQRAESAVGRESSVSPRNRIHHLASAHTVEASNPSSKDTKLVFTPPFHKRSLLAERQLLSFLSKRRSSFSILKPPFQVWDSKTACVSSANAVKALSMLSNSERIHSAGRLKSTNTPSLFRKKDSWDLCLTASKHYSELLNRDSVSLRPDDLSGDDIMLSERKRNHIPLAARDEGLNASQERPEW